MLYKLLFAAAAVLILLGLTCFGQPTDQVTAKIAQLRSLVGKELYNDYMHNNDFLYYYLQASNMNVDIAANTLRTTIKWRKENKIDALLNDTDLNCDADFPIVTDVITKDGQPVLMQDLGRWDFRKQVISGKSERFVLCGLRTVEVMQKKILLQNEEIARSGQLRGNVTSYIMLVNLQGFNLRQHGCFQCIAAVVNTIANYDKYYPGLIDRFILVNTPRTIGALVATVKAAVSKRTGDSIVAYGFDKNQWSTELFKIILKEQLPPAFGGTRH